MKELKEIVNECVKQIKPNVYEITDVFDIGMYIIQAKHDFIAEGKKLGIDDIYLVRSIFDLPPDLEYRSYTHNGEIYEATNPFSQLINNPFVRSRYSEEEEAALIERLKLVCPIHRDTIHYSLNGLVSDDWSSNYFTNREVAVVELFKEHLSNKLANFNPVDTFINVGEENEPIKSGAIIIMSKEKYLNLDSEMLSNLEDKKVFIFDVEKFKNKAFSKPLLLLVTDIVLSYVGVLPQHSITQSILRSESFTNFEGEEISDKEYLKMFLDLDEKISVEYLGKSYYNIDESVKNKRNRKDREKYGLFHDETKFYEDEKRINAENQLNCIKKYLTLLVEKLGLSQELYDDIYERYSTCVELQKKSSGITMGLIDFIKGQEFLDKVTFEKLVEVTDEFNAQEREIINSKSTLSSKHR